MWPVTLACGTVSRLQLIGSTFSSLSYGKGSGMGMGGSDRHGAVGQWGRIPGRRFQEKRGPKRLPNDRSFRSANIVVLVTLNTLQRWWI